MYLVTGHYDSRNSSNENTRDPAPGANDDASGVAVSLACARVLSRMQFPATLVFVAVAGEEQGLNGSRHLARLARSQGWELEGVLNNDIVGGAVSYTHLLRGRFRRGRKTDGAGTDKPRERVGEVAHWTGKCHPAGGDAEGPRRQPYQATPPGIGRVGWAGDIGAGGSAGPAISEAAGYPSHQRTGAPVRLGGSATLSTSIQVFL